MLIGQDNAEMILTYEFKAIKSLNMFISRCNLGWSVHDTSLGKCSCSINCSCITKSRCCEDNEEINNLIKSHFDLDSLGVCQVVRLNEKDHRALEKTSRYVNDSWETGSLWKSDDLEIPESRNNALKRLLFLDRKLDRDENYANLYYKEKDRLFENGFVEKAKSKGSGKRVWYFEVSNVNKPGRVRLVFDTASKSKGISFNDLLLTGPDLYTSHCWVS